MTVGCVLHATHTARVHQKNTIVYLSGEGSLTNFVHALVNKSCLAYATTPFQALHLDISRAQVVIPAYADNLNELFRFMLRRFPNLTRADIWNLISMYSQSSFQTAHECHSAREEPIRKSTAFTPGEQKLLYEELSRCRAELRSELLHTEIPWADSLLWDIGWRGTIQDSLSRLLGIDLPGAYLAIFGGANTKGMKASFLVEGRRPFRTYAQLRQTGPLENAWTGDYGRSLNMSISSPQNIAPREAWRSVDDDITATLRDRLPLHTLAVCQEIETRNMSLSAVRAAVQCALEAFIKYPSGFHAQVWFEREHFDPLNSDKLGATFNANDVRIGERSWLRKMQSRWPEGYMALSER